MFPCDVYDLHVKEYQERIHRAKRARTAQAKPRLVVLLLGLILLALLPTVAFAQDEIEIASEVEQHEANVWDAKVEFYREVEANQLLLATWDAKVEFYREVEFAQRIAEHVALTWEAKTAFYQSLQLDAE